MPLALDYRALVVITQQSFPRAYLVNLKLAGNNLRFFN
jgi:hypothetical protein